MIHLPREVIADLKRVPELPVSVSRLLAVINDERHGLHDIVTIVRHDAVLTARVLKVANSAAYALPVPVTTIDRAVPVLGESMIIGITLAESVAALHHHTGHAGGAPIPGNSTVMRRKPAASGGTIF